MSSKHQLKTETVLKAGLAAATLIGGVVCAASAASALDRYTEERIAAGYAVTQVPVDLTGKDAKQVGLGSYIVNTTGVCNHCHSADQYYQAQYPETWTADTGNPYFLHTPKGPYQGGILKGQATFVIDHTTFVAGGQFFGQVRSKNLTPAPDQRVANPTASTPNYAAGGINWIDFWGVLHNGTDLDQLLTQCGTGTNGPAGCAKAPANAYVLQVMPWPVVRHLTDSDLNAVWQYLSAIPCNTDLSNVNGPGGSNIANTYGGGVLINGCFATTTDAVTKSKGRYKFYTYADGKLLPRDAP